MVKRILFIHGAGKGAYKEDLLFAARFQKELGTAYKVHCPEMPDESNAPLDLWMLEIEKQIQALNQPVILIGHSMGASHLVKTLVEINAKTHISGVFLLNAPFWGGEGWLYEGYEELEISKDSVSNFPKNTKTYFYHARDDQIVPFTHLALYAKLFPSAKTREIETGGHQLSGDLSVVIKDINSL